MTTKSKSTTAVAGPALSEGLGAAAEARWRYYYRVTACTASHASDDTCICWHEEGTGPRPEERHESEVPLVAWREPNVGAKLETTAPAQK